MRAISEHLLRRLADLPGVETISNRLDGGKQIIAINGREISVGPFASDTEIEVALRLALQAPRKDVPMTDEPEATPLPPVEMVKPEQAPARVGRPIPAGGDYRPGALKELLAGLKSRKQNVMSEAVREAKRAHKALNLVENTSADMRATTAGILDEFREFTNDIPDLDAE